MTWYVVEATISVQYLVERDDPDAAAYLVEAEPYEIPTEHTGQEYPSVDRVTVLEGDPESVYVGDLWVPFDRPDLRAKCTCGHPLARHWGVRPGDAAECRIWPCKCTAARAAAA